MTLETVERIEPARLENPSADIIDVIAELSASAAVLGKALHPMTAASLAAVVRIMNTYYSNLIEGHNTRPRDIERALSGELDEDEGRRNLQIEAAAHVRVQAKVDSMAQDGALPPPASSDFLRWLHLEFFHGAPASMLTLKHGDRSIDMTPGEWRNLPDHDVEVGRHIPPSSARVADFMRHFESRFRFDTMGPAARILAMASAHHRFNYIHPFPDGNGRVSRLMSHAMAAQAGIGAHGLWSISRGLARGLESRTEYKAMMDHADTPRQGDRDGRGNLSEAALQEFVFWFLRVCLDQVQFMSSLFDLNALSSRIHRYVQRHETLKPEAGHMLESILLRGELERGEAMRASGLPERSARRVLGELIALGLLASETPKGKVSLRFPAHALEDLFPKLYPQS
jgi:Fic family protein